MCQDQLSGPEDSSCVGGVERGERILNLKERGVSFWETRLLQEQGIDNLEI